MPEANHWVQPSVRICLCRHQSAVNLVIYVSAGQIKLDYEWSWEGGGGLDSQPPHTQLALCRLALHLLIL